MLETHRRLYNVALDGKCLCWETAQTNWTFHEQCSWLTQMRHHNKWYGKLNCWSAQNTLRTLDKAYQNFFKRGAGFPRFKSRDRFNCFAFDMGNNGGGCKIVDRKLRIQHVGSVRVRWHRQLPEDGVLKQARIVREGDRWFVCFSVLLPDPQPTTLTTEIGIDLGIRSFVTTSDGETLGDSKIGRREAANLRRAQRALSRCERGSHRRQDVKKRVTRVYAKVRNYRRDMHHKVVRSLVDRYGVIAVESLNVQEMLKNHRLACSIADAGWSQFAEILKGKAESAGVRVVEVNAWNTSQDCSACGKRVTKSLSVRTHRCDCGCVLDRDVNAAKNILARAVPGIANAGAA